MARLAKIPMRWSPFTITTATGRIQFQPLALFHRRPRRSNLAAAARLTFGIAVGIHRVVGKADLVPLSRGIHNKVY